MGHHVQKLLGIEGKVHALEEQNPGSANGLSVKLELQADCLAGVWAHSTEERKLLDAGDVESALGTKISADLPYDPFLYLKAVNEGIPIVRGAPRTPPAERLLRLATTVFGAGAAAAVAGGGDGVGPAREEKKGGGLFGRRRR